MYVQGVTSEDSAQVLKYAGKHRTLCSLLNNSTTVTTVMSKIFTVARTKFEEQSLCPFKI